MEGKAYRQIPVPHKKLQKICTTEIREIGTLNVQQRINASILPGQKLVQRIDRDKIELRTNGLDATRTRWYLTP